jgi:hypothetical protein
VMAERVHQRMHAQAPFVKCILNMLAESAWLKREPMRAQTISRSKKRRHERVRQEERGGQLHPLNPVLAWQTAATAASAAAAALASRTGVLAHVRSNLLSLVGCVCNLGTVVQVLAICCNRGSARLSCLFGGSVDGNLRQVWKISPPRSQALCRPRLHHLNWPVHRRTHRRTHQCVFHVLHVVNQLFKQMYETSLAYAQ